MCSGSSIENASQEITVVSALPETIDSTSCSQVPRAGEKSTSPSSWE